MKRTLETFSYKNNHEGKSSATFILTENNEFFGKKFYCIERLNYIEKPTKYDSYDSVMVRWNFLKRIEQIYSRALKLDERFCYGKDFPWNEKLLSYDLLLRCFSYAADLKIENQKVTYFFLIKNILESYSDEFQNNKSKLPVWIVSKIENAARIYKAGLKIEVIKDQVVRVFFKPDYDVVGVPDAPAELIESIYEVDCMDYVVSWRARLSTDHYNYYDHNKYWGI